MPLSYFQGLTHSAAGSWFFDGITVGLYRTDRDLRQNAANPDALRRRPRGAGLQPHRRPDLGRARGRPPAPAARVLRPRRAQRRQHLRARRDRRGRPRHPAAALRRGPRPRRHRQGDVGRGRPRRLAAVDVQRGDLLAYDTAAHRAGRRAAAPGPGAGWRARFRPRVSPAPSSIAGACSSPARTRARCSCGRSISTGATAPCWSSSCRASRRSPRASTSRRARRDAALAAVALAPGGKVPTYGPGHSELLTFVAAEDARLRVRVAPTPRWPGARRGHRHGDPPLQRARAPGLGARVAVGSAHVVTGRDGTAQVIVARSRPGAVRVTATKERLRAGRSFVVVRAGCSGGSPSGNAPGTPPTSRPPLAPSPR